MSEALALPTLYKKTSTGAIQTWRIDVEGSTIVSTYGQLDGKLQTARDTITEGKNVGKSNETTPEQQAVLEATSQWEKKSKRGYVQTIDDASDGNVDAQFVAGGINPMLAQSFAKHGAKIVFPAYVQPKLDGHRCVAMRTNGVWSLWSRTRKPITGVPHILDALNASGIDGDIVLDGELYNHDYRDRFEELTSFIKRPDPKPGHEVVQYHVYDVASDAPFSVRTGEVSDAVAFIGSDSVVEVETHLVTAMDVVESLFSDYSMEGYEGVMLRNSASPYVQKRSYDLQKVKEFLDGEYLVVAVEAGRGKMADCAVFVCETPDGERFNVKMKGSLESLKQYLDDQALAVGRQLTVQYQGLTAYGVPRFPIGLRLRQDV